MVRDVTPAELARGLTDGTMMVVDVREPPEIDVERIADSYFLPFSVFDPGRIPILEGKTVVFMCAAGIRSARAVEVSQAAGLPFEAHLAGGLVAWKAAGLPVER